jgi:hypothetical protein
MVKNLSEEKYRTLLFFQFFRQVEISSREKMLNFALWGKPSEASLFHQNKKSPGIFAKETSQQSHNEQFFL